MKKVLVTLILGLILFAGIAEAKIERDRLKTGDVYEGEIIWTSKIRVALPPGKWTVIEKWTWVM